MWNRVGRTSWECFPVKIQARNEISSFSRRPLIKKCGKSCQAKYEKWKVLQFNKPKNAATSNPIFCWFSTLFCIVPRLSWKCFLNSPNFLLPFVHYINNFVLWNYVENASILKEKQIVSILRLCLPLFL